MICQNMPNMLEIMKNVNRILAPGEIVCRLFCPVVDFYEIVQDPKYRVKNLFLVTIKKNLVWIRGEPPYSDRSYGD